MKVVAFAASSSSKSINKKLVTYASGLLKGYEVEILDINDYGMPLFSVDKEEEIGKPELAKQFIEKIESADALIISFAEHNGSFTAAYKNLIDWCSRTKGKVYEAKPVVALSTSPGGRGGQSVIEQAITSIKYFGGETNAQFSLPSFNDNFDEAMNSISSPELDAKFKKAVSQLTL